MKSLLLSDSIVTPPWVSKVKALARLLVRFPTWSLFAAVYIVGEGDTSDEINFQWVSIDIYATISRCANQRRSSGSKVRNKVFTSVMEHLSETCHNQFEPFWRTCKQKYASKYEVSGR